MSQNRTPSLSTNESYRPLFNAALPKTINVSYTIPKAGGVVEKVFPNDFAHQLGMKGWTETVLIDKPLSQPLNKDELPGQVINENRLKQILSRVEANRDKQVISYMNQEVGWGVFVRDKIAKSDYVSIYAGVQIPTTPQDAFSHAQAEYYFDIDSYGQQLGVIDGKEYGNISRFYQHLPMAELPSETNNITLENYLFQSPQAKAKIATANLLALPFNYNNGRVFVMQATREIENEWVGFDYGNYWLNSMAHPVLFYKDGSTVAKEDYTFNKWILRTYVDGRQYAQFSLTHEDILRSSYIGQTFQFEDENRILNGKITPKDFREAFAKTPKTSPYIYLEKPSEVSAIKKSNEPTPSNAKATNQTDKLSLKQGFFVDSKKLIVEQLTRITNQFSGVNWKYNEKNNVAYLEHENKDVIKQIKSYLEDNGCQTQSGRNEKSKQPLLYVKNPKIKKLTEIPPYLINQDKNAKPYLAAVNV